MSDEIEHLDVEDSTQVLGDFAMELADRLKSEHGEDVSIGEVIVLAEVELMDGVWTVDLLSSERRPYVVAGILDQAARVTRATDVLHFSDEDDEPTEP